MSRTVVYTVPKELDGEKLIVFLRGHIKISARLLPKLKNDPLGLLRNGEHIRTVDRIYEGDVISISFPDEKGMIPPGDSKALDIVYEDDDILIINKSPYIAMHPTHNHQGDTLANNISAYFTEKNRDIVFRAVGRLDKCTSGLVIIALNAHAANILSENVDKEYLALAGGCFRGEGTIIKPIIRPDPGKTYRWVGEGGEYAVTHWKSEMTDGSRSLLRVTLETGRTHQIRVHFASEGTPLLGDDMYGSKDRSLDRAALHCAKLSFSHPITKEKLTFEAPLPEDMNRVAEDICSKIDKELTELIKD
ncbi:MAG: RluA family pseudouridine synthase [Clostridia bacterium]|nr:RluA family pseudouridine synthase [Clostridia bacterium]